MIRCLSHILVVAILTLLTQIGGIIWILSFGYFRLRKFELSWIKRLSAFLILYLIATFIIVPPIAKLFGRTPLPVLKSGNLIPHNILMPLLNRHYVIPEAKEDLIQIADQMNVVHSKLKVSYLDANFPFIDGFPLLPHLSHDDGRKVDLSFYYSKKNKVGNYKPSNSGYGEYVEPLASEINQNSDCKSKGYWQYDITKYMTLGSREDLDFDLESTKRLVQLIIDRPKVKKLFIEPHIKKRIQVDNTKIRFHGCHAVRHDDHIHYEY